MTIREFTMNDYSEIHTLWYSTPGVCRCEKCILLDSRDNIERYLSRNCGMSFVAQDDESAGKLVGAVLAGHDGRTGIIYRLAVAERLHKRGIGRMLVEKAVAALKLEGITNVKAFVLCENNGGNTFWGKVGFELLEKAVTRTMEI
jgi:ribosomal protein S18 acetylase RimI-like enzyme